MMDSIKKRLMIDTVGPSENMNKRSSNFELMRIFAMIMIISHHYVVHGIMSLEGRADYSIWRKGSFLNKLFSSAMLPGGGIGIALFFMITGYFSLNNEEHLKLKKIVLTSFFYGWLAVGMFLFAYCIKLDVAFFDQFRYVFKSLLSPVTGGAWWYVTAYFWLALLSPTINRLIKDFSIRQLAVCIFFVGLFGYVIDSYTGTKFLELQRAILFYLIGCFCKRNEIKRMRRHSYFLLFTFTWILLSVMMYYTSSVDAEMIVNRVIVKAITATNAFVITPLCAVFIFEWFAQYEKTKNEYVNKVGKTTFGIYLFHDSFIAEILIWNVIFDVRNTQFISVAFPFYAIGTVFIVFIMGMVVDIFREKFADQKLREACKLIEKIFSKL